MKKRTLLSSTGPLPARARGHGDALIIAATLLVLPGAMVAAEAPPAEAVPAPEEKPKWQTSAGVGFSYATGNTENLLLTANIETARNWTKNELMLGASLGYGQTEVQVRDSVTGEVTEETQKNTDFIRGFGQYNRVFSEKLYAYARAEGLHDDIAELMYRVTLSPGVGYHFIKKPATILSGELGPGYIWQRKYDENTGEYFNEDYATIRVSQRFQQKFGERARIWESAEYLPEISDFSNFIINAEVGVEADLTKKLALRVVAQDTYDSEPSPGREENDFRLIVGLNYKL